jgi:hypothetical protein
MRSAPMSRLRPWSKRDPRQIVLCYQAAPALAERLKAPIVHALRGKEYV